VTKAVGARDVSSSVVFAGLNVSILVPSADLVDPSAGRVRGFFDRHPVESKTERDFFPAAWMRDDGEQTLSFHVYLFGVGREGARRPVRLRKSASCVCFFDGRVVGVFFFETTFVGRQYCSFASPLCPHGFPVALSIHFSRAHRRRLFPFSVLRTSPRLFRHFATACEARADGHTLYCALTCFVQ